MRDITSAGFSAKSDVRTRLGIIIATELQRQREELALAIEGMELVDAKETRKSAFGMVNGDAPIFKGAYNVALEEAAALIRGESNNN